MGAPPLFLKVRDLRQECRGFLSHWLPRIVHTFLMSSVSEEPDTKEVKEIHADDADESVESLRRRVKEMEDELTLSKLQSIMAPESDNTSASASSSVRSESKSESAPHANGPDVDARSIYVGSVDYSVTPEELQTFFSSCGTVKRITILCDKFTGHPKGFAYVEFADVEAVANAMMLNETELKGRQLKISPKRSNMPGFSSRGRGGRGQRRGFSRGGFYGRSRGRGHRRGFYAPY